MFPLEFTILHQFLLFTWFLVMKKKNHGLLPDMPQQFPLNARRKLRLRSTPHTPPLSC